MWNASYCSSQRSRSAKSIFALADPAPGGRGSDLSPGKGGMDDGVVLEVNKKRGGVRFFRRRVDQCR